MKTGMKVERAFADRYEGNIWDSAGAWTFRTARIEGVDGEVVFEQEGIDAPVSWSDLAVRVVAQKYFRGDLGTAEREDSIRTLIERVARTIATWGWEDGYFDSGESRDAFYDDLVYLLLNQRAAFNSPVWFNVGVDESPQCSACFIHSVGDSMESILTLAKNEGMIFKYGSGSGSNLSRIRGKNEGISGGGVASGPVSFMRGYDAFAGAIKSGGKCLAPNQRIYTAEWGPIPVSNLEEESFHVLSFDPPTGRVMVKEATAWRERVRKRIATVKTDKGVFRLSEDHPVKLATGGYLPAGELRPGMPLFASTVDEHVGYVRVGLRDGAKGRDLLHRMMMRDVVGEDVYGKVVQHRDGDPLHNDPENLEVMTQSEHASIHGRENAERGEHPFVRESFLKSGSKNGMYASGSFWSDGERAKAYRARKSRELIERANAAEMQDLAARSKMINLAWRILEAGGSIDTFADYYIWRKKVIGKIAKSKRALLAGIEARFGTFDAFRVEVAANNHRVLSVEVGGTSEVFDVEVKCPTVDDGSPESGHNFMIWDGGEHFGSGVFVSNTRRAAKMVLLDADHPDVFEFVDCKGLEEAKARRLVEAGYEGGIDGEAYASVAFQNANHSVRVTDEFMEAVEVDGPWNLIGRRSREVVETVRARDLFDAIVRRAHACGDPGLHFSTTVNKWHTSPAIGEIRGSNPCSEYVYLDDSACNLASLNLRKFQRSDGALDTDFFVAAVEVLFLAQEILVDRSSYPTPAIAENSRRYRPIGIGYANLGAYLMAAGLPYDSFRGREEAAGITALMQGAAARTSARIAVARGPFEGFEANRAAYLRVMEEHASAYRNVYDYDRTDPREIYPKVVDVWEDVLRLGEESGFRNGQLSVLAPTGTIAFMMDCDTTGVEPDIALRKTKALVGGGSLTYVNGSIADALRVLGYSEEEQGEIEVFVRLQGTVEGCPVIKADHLAVFDCAFPARPGGRSIPWEGHVRMMEAVQPFISGAISKTVNLPADATVEDVADVYRTAWTLGLKSIAIYRDGSKEFQPLEVSADLDNAYNVHADPNIRVDVEALGLTAAESLPVESFKEPLKFEFGRGREKLPVTRDSRTHKFDIGGHEGYVTVGLYPDGRVGEMFVCMAKEGSTISGLMDAFATAVSISLQYGVPLEVLGEKFARTRFEPSGFTGELGYASSIVDYLFRWLEREFPHGRIAPRKAVEEAPETPSGNSGVDSGPPCPGCGAIMLPNGSCHRCPNCGDTSGCS